MITPEFDDRRTALPGATYSRDGLALHPGCDDRSAAIFASLDDRISHGDRIEYANIYELRSEGVPVPLGKGKSREIVYKTAWNPLPVRIIEKRLAGKSESYGTYTMVRVEAFRALGISYGSHRLLARHDRAGTEVHYYLRERYPGESFNALSPAVYQKPDSSEEDPDVVRGVIGIMGKAAAENLILKKFSIDADTIRFGEGKEIIEFGTDPSDGKAMPMRYRLCSVRGTMGWPDMRCTPENLAAIFKRYIATYAGVVAKYVHAHPSVPHEQIVDAFVEGFKSRTREIYWNYRAHREQFEQYGQKHCGQFQFRERWAFVLWALNEQYQRLDELEAAFRRQG